MIKFHQENHQKSSKSIKNQQISSNNHQKSSKSLKNHQKSSNIFHRASKSSREPQSLLVKMVVTDKQRKDSKGTWSGIDRLVCKQGDANIEYVHMQRSHTSRTHTCTQPYQLGRFMHVDSLLCTLPCSHVLIHTD